MKFKLTMSAVIGTDCIGRCKYNYHTAMMALKLRFKNPPYHADPDSPQTYVAMSNILESTKAENTPLYPVIALNPPPDPNTPMIGTYK